MSQCYVLPRNDGSIAEWIADYKARHAALLRENPDFARWLDENYIPIAGGWQY